MVLIAGLAVDAYLINYLALLICWHTEYAEESLMLVSLPRHRMIT